MEEMLEKIQQKQKKLIQLYFCETSKQKKEEIRKQLYLLSLQYIEISKKMIQWLRSSMQNIILEIFKDYKTLDRDYILNLNGSGLANNAYKLNLLKDQKKGVKISDSSFYMAKNNYYIKVSYNEIINKLTLFPSSDLDELSLYIKNLKKLNFNKIEVYCTNKFYNLQKQLLKLGYIIELIRKERFLNNNIFEDEIVLSYIKE